MRGAASSYLASRDELKRAEGAPHVGNVGLEVVESLFNCQQLCILRLKTRTLATLVSISDGFCLDGLLGAILLSEGDDMLAASSSVVDCRRRVVGGGSSRR